MVPGRLEPIMTFSTIMACVDVESANDASLRIAADLAVQFDAKLIGIAAADLPWSYLAQESTTLALIEQLRSEMTTRLAAAEARFRSAANRLVQQSEWRSAIAPPANYIALQARAADLIVVNAKRDDALLDRSAGQFNPGDLVMEAGRPVLVVPPKTASLKQKCAVVAWKDAREARRAVSDALPLLRNVQEVVVVEVIQEEVERSSAHVRLDDVVRWLARHDVAATARAFDFPDGKDPIDKLWEYGADFIVSGAYGHARLREWVFGGFTEPLLNRSPHCLLFSH